MMIVTTACGTPEVNTVDVASLNQSCATMESVNTLFCQENDSEYTEEVACDNTYDDTIQEDFCDEDEVVSYDFDLVEGSYWWYQPNSGETKWGICQNNGISIEQFDQFNYDLLDEDDSDVIYDYIQYRIPYTEYTTENVESTAEHYSNEEAQYSGTEESSYMLWSVTLYNPEVASASWENIKRCIDDINYYGLTIPAYSTWSWCNTPITYSETGDPISLGLLTTWYPEAGAYGGNGESITAPGGGVCQVATGVMQVSREALTDEDGNCSMVYGKNYFDHSGYVAYATRGNEAAVNYGSCDLTIPNTYGEDLHISGWYDSEATYGQSNWGTIELYCEIY